MNVHDPIRRHSREAVGVFFIAALALFVLALAQAERFREWLDPGVSVKVLMPAEGLYGLSAGADVEILGTVAGKVRDIVIAPGQAIHAEVLLRRDVMPFLRQDSEVFIKRRFGVAGDAYLQITRGTGAALDAEYAVLEASGEAIPTETLEQVIAEVRGRLVPILDQAQAAIGAVARAAATLDASRDDIRAFASSLRAISGRIERGEGSVGRLLTDATLIRDLEAVLAEARDAIGRLAPILAEMQSVARSAAVTSGRIGEQASRIPEITDRAAAVLGSLERVMDDVAQASPELPRLARNAAATTDELPLLIEQSRLTVEELEALVRRLRSHWLLGGAGAASEPGATRVPALEVTP